MEKTQKFGKIWIFFLYQKNQFFCIFLFFNAYICVCLVFDQKRIDGYRWIIENQNANGVIQLPIDAWSHIYSIYVEYLLVRVAILIEFAFFSDNDQ